MILLPTSKKEREEKRQEIYDRAAERAQYDAKQQHRSMKCAGTAYGREIHEDCKGGPERCICECHDGD